MSESLVLMHATKHLLLSLVILISANIQRKGTLQHVFFLIQILLLYNKLHSRFHVDSYGSLLWSVG